MPLAETTHLTDDSSVVDSSSSSEGSSSSSEGCSSSSGSSDSSKASSNGGNSTADSVNSGSRYASKYDARKLLWISLACCCCCLVLLLVILLPILLVNKNKEGDSFDGSRSSGGGRIDEQPRPNEVLIELTLAPVEGPMPAASQQVYLDTLDAFWAEQLNKDANTRMLLQEPVVNGGIDKLRTTFGVQVDAGVMDLANILLTDSTTLILALKATGDPYFASLVALDYRVSDRLAEKVFGNQPPPPPAPREAESAPTQAPSTTESQERLCNGLSHLCDIAVNRVLFGTLHNAGADAETMALFPNHNLDWTQALEAGWRGLNFDVGRCDEHLSLVHGVCGIGYQNLFEAMMLLQEFLDANPHEVVLMPLQFNDDTGGIVQIAELYATMQQAKTSSGSLVDRVYIKDGSGWPTLGEMIDMDQRVLVFVYNGQEKCTQVTCPPGVYDWFDVAAETDFQHESVAEIANDAVEACRITRGGSGSQDFFGINLFLQSPMQNASAVLNEKTFVEEHVKICSQLASLEPSLILIDFWGQGDVMEYVQEHNAALSLKGPVVPDEPALNPVTNSPTSSPVAATSQPILTESPTGSPVVATMQPILTTATPTALASNEPTFVTPTAAPVVKTSCNGHANHCDVPINEVVFATMHNAHATEADFPFAASQRYGISLGLEAGIRGINLNFGICDNELSLVFSSCFLGAANVQETLTTIQQFLTDNPNEVILMPSQIDDSTGGVVSMASILAVIQNATDSDGLSMDSRLYSHIAGGKWPTLQQLIDADQRILFFTFGGSESCAQGDCPFGFNDWEQYAAMTSDQVTSADSVLVDTSAACELSQGASGTKDFFGVNLFPSLPFEDDSIIMNEESFLRRYVQSCALQNGLSVNLIVVDFWSHGDVLKVVNELNAAEQTPATTKTTTAPTLTPITSTPTEFCNDLMGCEQGGNNETNTAGRN